MNKDYFFIAEVQRPQGIKGEVKIRAYTDDIDNMLSLKQVYIEEDDALKRYSIEQSHILGESLVLKLSGIDSREQAEYMRNKRIFISRHDASPLKQDEYYISDLIGFDIYDENGNFIGVLEDILSSYSQEIYSIKSQKGLYLCFKLKGLVHEISLDDKKIILDSTLFSQLGVLQ